MEIHIKIQSGLWRNAGTEAILKRIALVICGTADRVARQEHGYPWSLDQAGNDWWATDLDEQGVLKVSWRYGGGGNRGFMEHLEYVLNWLFR